MIRFYHLKPTWRRAPVLLLAFALLSGLPQFEAQTSAAEAIMLDRPLVIAHRGYSELAPENTLPAFDAAASAGADLIELDYRHSSDDVPVAIHDATLDRTTNADELWDNTSIAVGDTPLKALRTLDAGSWFKPHYTDVAIPSLADALTRIRTNAVTLIERKTGDPRTLVALLEAEQLMSEVVVQSFDWDFLKQVHALQPEIALAALGPPKHLEGKALSPPERNWSTRFFQDIDSMGSRILVWNRSLDRQAIAAAHKHGLKVWIYTINDASAATELLDRGVDGLITDNPARIWKAIALHSR